MSAPLLKTKLYVPSVRSEVVSRSRLVERLTEGLRRGRRLTVLSAPAGYGKTTLLSVGIIVFSQTCCVSACIESVPAWLASSTAGPAIGTREGNWSVRH